MRNINKLIEAIDIVNPGLNVSISLDACTRRWSYRIGCSAAEDFDTFELALDAMASNVEKTAKVRTDAAIEEQKRAAEINDKVLELLYT
jgi:hypothetical protein